MDNNKISEDKTERLQRRIMELEHEICAKTLLIHKREKEIIEVMIEIERLKNMNRDLEQRGLIANEKLRCYVNKK